MRTSLDHEKHRRLRRVALGAFVLIVLSGFVQHFFVLHQAEDDIERELEATASRLNHAIQEDTLKEYVNDASAYGQYFVIGEDGAIYDVGSDPTTGIIQGVLGDVNAAPETVPSCHSPASFPIRSRLFNAIETWHICSEPVRGGQILLGASSAAFDSDIEQRLIQAATRFSNTPPLEDARRAADKLEVDYAIITTDQQLYAAAGRIPLHTDSHAARPQGYGARSGTSPSGEHRIVLYYPYKGRVNGVIVVAKGMAQTESALRQQRNFQFALAGLSFLLFIWSVFRVWTSQERAKQVIAAGKEKAERDSASHHSPATRKFLRGRGEHARADRRELAILFSDIRGFTHMTSQMGPPALIDLLNEYLADMTAAVHDTGGSIDKFIGDAVMAYWGLGEQRYIADAPVRAALEMLERLNRLNAKWTQERRLSAGLGIGIGIHVGMVNIGYMGTEDRRDYTIIGDAVNLASRIEGLNKRLGTSILISEEARRHLSPEYVHQLELDNFQPQPIDGLDAPVRVFGVRAVVPRG